MNESKEAYNKSMLDAACKAGWNAAEGASEYDYYPCEVNLALGGIRIPNSGSWMYVRCSRIGPANGYIQSRWNPVRYENTYWRHRRFLPDWKDARITEIQGQVLAFFPAGNRGYIVTRNVGCQREGKLAIENYTVFECRRALQIHHPDCGGDPGEYQKWKARLAQRVHQ